MSVIAQTQPGHRCSDCRLEIGLILDIAEAQRAGIQTVFALVGGAGNHSAIKLSMFTDGDIAYIPVCSYTES